MPLVDFVRRQGIDTDFELGAFPPALAAGLLPFSRLGVVNSALTPKPALATWDAQFGRPLE